MAQRVIVVGAGIVGASVGYRLARGGAAVTVLDAGLPGTGASGRSFGWINASFHLSPAHFRLRLAAIEAWRRLAAEVPAAAPDWTGCLSWEADPEAEAARLGGLGYSCEVIGSRRIAGLVPGLARPPKAALWLAQEGAADPATAARAMLEAAAGQGARLWTGCPVSGIDPGPRGLTVAIPGDRLAADAVVVAAGTGAPGLLAPLGLTLPMLHRPAVMLRTRLVPIRLGTGPASPVLVSPEMEFRQDATGRILAPTSPGHQGDAWETFPDRPESLAEAALDALRRFLPGIDLQWETAILAERPVPGDRLPAVGPAGVPGLSLAVLHSGATLAPIIGELLAAEVLGADPAPLLAEFRPDRLLK